MDQSGRRRLGAVLLVGLVYFLVGRLFALPRDHVHLWRLAAWAVSGAAFLAHIAYERTLRHPPARAAAYVALAAAIGACALAAAVVTGDASRGAVRPGALIALVAWPLITAVPAYLVALVALLLVRVRGRPAVSAPDPARDRHAEGTRTPE